MGYIALFFQEAICSCPTDMWIKIWEELCDDVFKLIDRGARVRNFSEHPIVTSFYSRSGPAEVEVGRSVSGVFIKTTPPEKSTQSLVIRRRIEPVLILASNHQILLFEGGIGRHGNFTNFSFREVSISHVIGNSGLARSPIAMMANLRQFASQAIKDGYQGALLLEKKISTFEQMSSLMADYRRA